MHPNIIIVLIFTVIVLTTVGTVYFLFESLVKSAKYFRERRKLLTLYKLEFIGHALLIVSIVWLFISNPLASITSNAEAIETNRKIDAIYYRINQMEDNIYRYQELKKETADSIGWKAFNDQLLEYNKIWNSSEVEVDEAESQNNLSSILSIVVLLISTILIAIGRLGDLIVSLNTNSRNIN